MSEAVEAGGGSSGALGTWMDKRVVGKFPLSRSDIIDGLCWQQSADPGTGGQAEELGPASLEPQGDKLSNWSVRDLPAAAQFL